MATARPKTFKVRFYAAHVQQPEGAQRYRIADLFRELGTAAAGAAGLCPPHSEGGLNYEIRDLTPINNGQLYMGVFAVMRDDAPHIRARDGTERPITLGDDEGLIEKNHFIFRARHGLLIYQVNRHANHPSRFESYLTAMAGPDKAVLFGDILTQDAWQKLQRGVVKRVEITFDMPRNPLQHDPGDFSNRALRDLDQAGASREKIVLSTSRGHEGMRGWIKDQIRRAHRADIAESLKVKLDGEDGMLDLIAQTVRDEIQVTMHGRYPDSRDTFEQLEEAYDRQRETLGAHFGQ